VLNRIRRRLSYANVMASVALFVALGGVSYAAASKNSVISSSIKNGQVKSVDIANNAVTSSKIKNGNVGNKDLGPKSVSAAKLTTALKTDLDDAATVGGLSTAQIVAAAGGEYTEARQAAGSKDIETLTAQDLVTLNLTKPGKYLITARVPIVCTYDGSDGNSNGNPNPPAPGEPFFIGKANLLVAGVQTDTINQTCEAEAAITAILVNSWLGTATAEFTRQITITGPTAIKLQGLAETSLAFIFPFASSSKVTATAQNSILQAISVHTP
jgi:hypothetical protein